MTKNVKNIAASARARLLRIAKDNDRNFNTVLLQYFQERMLYRLSISSYKLNFVLKGALLFLIYDIPRSRPTKDIDFLGMDTSNTKENLIEAMKEISNTEVADGVKFDISKITAEDITEDADYKGVRIYCEASLGQAISRFHFDIGFGDKIVPNPVKLDFPVLLDDMPIPSLIAYTPESAIAEKFEAIVKLGLATSRMKDFFDIYHLSSYHNFKAAILKEAIKTTFKNRLTSLTDRFNIYEDKFMNDKDKQTQWLAFIRRTGIESNLSFSDCIMYIKNFIEPLFDSNNIYNTWNRDLGSWSK